MTWRSSLAALVLLAGMVLSPLRATAATVPTLFAYDAAGGAMPTTAFGREDALRCGAEPSCIGGYDQGGASYDVAANPRVVAAVRTIQAYDDALELPERCEVGEGVIYSAALALTAAEGGEALAQG